MRYVLFFVNAPAFTVIYTLSLHDALPICPWALLGLVALPLAVPPARIVLSGGRGPALIAALQGTGKLVLATDRKSTRLNSSHQIISYAVFCLKKKST